MSAHGIDVFNFEFWEGSQPKIPQENVVTHTKPGADGVAQTRVGKWSQPFSARVVGDYPTFVDAVLAWQGMTAIVGTGPVPVKWNELNLTGLFGVWYFVDRVDLVSVNRHPRLSGPGYSYIGGGRVILDVRMTPHQP